MTTARIKPMPASALPKIADPCRGCGYAHPAIASGDNDGATDRRSPQQAHPRRNGSRRIRRPRAAPPIRRRDASHRDGEPGGDSPKPPAWAVEVADLWGMCGLSAHIDGETPGYLTLTAGELVPELALPGWAGSTRKQLNWDAAVILGIDVCAAYRGQHIGRSLVRAAAAQLVRRQVGMIEVIAVSGRPVRLSPKYSTRSDGAGSDGAESGVDGQPSMMLLPVGFWLATGFRIIRPHPVAPTLRLDLAGTERWLPDFAGAWQRFAELLSQPVPPRPASFSDTHPIQRVDEPVPR